MILTRCGSVAEKTSMAKKRKKAAKRQPKDSLPLFDITVGVSSGFRIAPVRMETS